MKKILSSLLILFIIFGMFSNVFASELNTKLDIVQQSGEIKYLEKDQGYISKSIVDSDVDYGKVTINLSLSNITNSTTEEKENYDSNEIFIIVSENIVNNSENLNTYVQYINTLANKVFQKNSNTKIGIIGMKGTIKDTYVGEDGKMLVGENDESEVKGTAENAEIAVKLTKSVEDIQTGLQNMNSNKTTYRVNLQSAIRLANNSFSENANKLLISLYDGVPKIAIGVKSTYSYGGWSSQYKTIEEALVAQHTHVSTNTKAEIMTLKNNNVEFILIRPEDTSYDEKWYNADTGEFITDFDGSPYVKEIYGTLENPTYGKMYSLSNSNLDKVITEYIYQDIIKDIRVDIKSAVINEYFSGDIIKNFDITFANKDVDITNLNNSNYVIWNIGNVRENESVNLQYTLQIKDMKNKELLNKVISTSEKTELKYVNYLDSETTVVSTSSPKIKLSEVLEELTATVSYDPTTSTNEKVTATIKTNKKVMPVNGWDLSEDGKKLTKVYLTNAKETVHLVDEDTMTKDVEINISNIKDVITKDNDNTVANGSLPKAGIKTIISIIFLVFLIVIFTLTKYRRLKDIK